MNYKHGVIHFIFTLLAYLGLPMVGWGLADMGAFFFNLARLGYALMVLISAFLGAYQGMVIPEDQDQKDKRNRGQVIFLILLEILGAGLLLWFGFGDRWGWAAMPENQGLRSLGLVLAFSGGAFMFWSVLNLGRQYSAQVTIQKDHTLITHGLYHYIRHPRYLGLVILLSGAALIFRSWVGIGADLALLAALIWRIRIEEKLLHQEFGEKWVDYCKCTWKLVPWVW